MSIRTIARGACLVMCLMIFYVLLDTVMFLSMPISTRGGDVNVVIPEGASFRQVGDILKNAGLLDSPFRFYVLGVTTRTTRLVRAGHYRLNGRMLPTELLRKLVRGEIVAQRVTIPEGLTLRQVAGLMERFGIIAKKGDMIALGTSRDFARRWGIGEEGVEGYLFPDTYFFAQGLAPERAMGTMIERFWQVYDEDVHRGISSLSLKTDEVVVLASIIEKESSLSHEQPLISAVFHNRLKKGIPLCSDPTVIYGMDDFDGNLSKEDLQRDNPYNTYTRKGLPPGPIANPGRLSIRAALNPAPVNYVYFVSKNDGTHHFSATLKEHNDAVIRYQKRRYR